MVESSSGTQEAQGYAAVHAGHPGIPEVEVKGSVAQSHAQIHETWSERKEINRKVKALEESGWKG